MTSPELFAGLFDRRVATYEVDLRTLTTVGDLFPEEAAQMTSARPERVFEFRAGRHCARMAMDRLGLVPRPILRAEDRSPIWPEGVVGSITHTRSKHIGFCAAAVARTADLRAVGIDVEPDSVLEEKLWERVLTPAERSFIQARRPEDRGLLAKFVFSAKESTYKCQYTVSGQFLEFHEVEVVMDLSPSGTGVFLATLCKDVGVLPLGHQFQGHATRGRGLLLTAVILP